MDANTTRRNLLRIGTTAAAYAAGASISTGGVALPSQAKGATLTSRSAWDAAWLRHEQALAADVPISARHANAEATGTMNDALEKEWDTSGTRMGDAEWALFETPAPDAKALDWKLTMLSTRGLVFEDDIAANIIADVRHLAAQEGR